MESTIPDYRMRLLDDTLFLEIGGGLEEHSRIRVYGAAAVDTSSRNPSGLRIRAGDAVAPPSEETRMGGRGEEEEVGPRLWHPRPQEGGPSDIRETGELRASVGASGLCVFVTWWWTMRSHRFGPLEAERSAQQRLSALFCLAT
jgi:hypothetical protein